MQNEETAVAESDSQALAQNAYSIRQARPEDLLRSFQLVEEYFQEIGVLLRDTLAEFAQYLQGGGNGVWLAFDREQPIGCIVLHSLTSLPRSAEIKRLFVRPAYRRQGLADRLLEALEQSAVKLSYEWLYLDTKDDLDNAIRFYHRHGYQRCDRYNRNPQATIFMRKRLEDDSPAIEVRTETLLDNFQSRLFIRSFRPEDSVHFRRLNEEWITQYFRLEEKDSQSLNDPSQYILSPGGYIGMAFVDEDAVGCCALIPLEEATFEVAKMAVTPAWQGRGLGRKLLEHVIREARQLQAKRLYLETNSRLRPAIRLYESLGFRHLAADRVIPSPYQRADVYMELFLEQAAQSR
jgi:GNAT superfamily N-acetyltransferase